MSETHPLAKIGARFVCCANDRIPQLFPYFLSFLFFFFAAVAMFLRLGLCRGLQSVAPIKVRKPRKANASVLQEAPVVPSIPLLIEQQTATTTKRPKAAESPVKAQSVSVRLALNCSCALSL